MNELCLYFKKAPKGLMYVNDVLLLSCEKEAITETKKNLCAAFKTKDLGIVEEFLGTNVPFEANL